MNVEREIIGRRIFLFTNPDGTTLAEKPNCCRRLFPETEKLKKYQRTFKSQDYDISNREKWNKLMGKTSDNEDESTIIEKAQSILDDIDEILKDDS